MNANAIILLVASFFTGLAVLFSIIAVASPGWNAGHDVALFKRSSCPKDPCLGSGVLLILAIIFLAFGVLFYVVSALRIIAQPPIILKYIIYIIHLISAIFIVSAYVRAVTETKAYSVQLSVTAGIFSFASLSLVSYWIGRTSFIDNWMTKSTSFSIEKRCFSKFLLLF